MRNKKFSYEQIYTVCWSLSHQLHAGIGVADALYLLAEDFPRGPVRQRLEAMARQADGGMDLAQIFRQADCFPREVCSLLAVGQQTGKTEKTLAALAEHYEKRESMRRQLRSAVLYPVILSAAMLAVAVVLLVWVLPVFNEVYGLLGSSLTGVAGFFLLLGRGIRRLLPVLAAVLGVAAVVFAGLWAVPRARRRLCRFCSAAGRDRGVSAKWNAARFSQALALGLSSGMTDVQAVETALSMEEEGSQFRRRCYRCLTLVEGGKNLPAALRETALLPGPDSRMLEAAIRSGQGETVMARIAARMTQRAEQAMESRLACVEPALVIVNSLMLGGILLAVMLPLMHIMAGLG